MKRIILRIALVAILIQIAGCRRILDRYFHGGGTGKINCRLATFKQFVTGDRYRTGTVYYTPDGRPLNVMFTHSGAFRTGSHHFVYDDYRRLIQYYSAVDIMLDKGHWYGYENGRIVKDTLLVLTGPQMMSISQLYYDEFGRVVKEEIEVVERDFNPTSEHDTLYYDYDNNGNLITSATTGYDNKTFYLRTHPEWMFVHRNYSRNNPLPVTGYNEAGLPTGFGNNIFGFLDFPEPVEISYECE